MRLFIAIDIPSAEKAKIAAELVELKRDYRDFRWVAAANYHITLHFLGEVPEGELKPLISHIENTIFDTRSFYLYALHGGIFIRNKITLYLEFQKNRELTALVDAVRTIQTPYQNNHKIFIPHLTLARYKIPSKQQYLLIKKKFNKFAPDTSFEVSKIYLFSSTLNEKTPEYTKVAEFDLH